MSIKTGLFLFPTFSCIISPISGIIDYYCITNIFKKSGKNKNKLRTIYPKNHEHFKNNSLGSNFTGSYIKKSEMVSNLPE